MALSGSIGSERPSFLDCLALLDEFDKLCSKQKLPSKFEELTAEKKEIIKANIEKNKKEATAKENELLSKFSIDSKEYTLLVEILKNIKIRQGLLEKPDEKPDFYSKYAPHLNQEIYHEILPYCQLAYLYEQNGVAEEHAEKLSVLFDSVKDILSYFQIQSQNKKEPDENLVHDACLFELRDLNNISKENWKKWKILVNNDKGNTAFIMEILPNAKAIEELIASHYSKEKKPQEVQKSTAELIKKISETNKKVKSLSSKAAELDENEEKTLEIARKELSDLKIALFEACKGLALIDLNIAYLTAFNQKLLSNLGSFSYLVSKIGEQNYHRFKKLKDKREKNYREHNCEGNNDIYIPNITIDGKDLEPPIEGFYLMKVDVQDELQAARAACLGKLTDCCQSLSGEAGDPCAEHGLTSPYGGFYVICKGDPNNPTIDHNLFGQCWAWRSQNDAIVFDSIEVADKYNDFCKKTVAAFFNALAVKMIENGSTHKVVCGASSGISKHVGFDASLNRTEHFRDYSGYSDSRFQRVLQDKNAPFYFFSTNEACKQKTIALAEEAMRIGSPLVESDYMVQLLNFITLEISKRTNIKSKFSQGYHDETFLQSVLAMRNEILTISEQFNRKDEVLNILEGIEKYLELTDENIDLIIEKIKNKKFSTKTLNKNKDSILLVLLKKAPMTESLKSKINDLIDSLDKDIINLPDDDGLTPFMRAAQLKDLNLCKKLREKGAEVTAVDRDRENVLFNAYSFLRKNKNFEKEDLDFLLQLISEFKIDINSVDRNGETLLMKLAKTNHVSFLEELINAGARTNIKDDFDQTALEHAITARQKESILFLIDKCKDLINIPNTDGKTPLHLAIDQSMPEACLELIVAGANVNAPNKEGDTPLSLAVKKGMVDVCIALIARGANIKYDLDNTILIHALSARQEKISLFLIDQYKDLVNIPSADGDTPLHLAIISSMPLVCRKLIEAGASVNTPDKAGNTPFDLVTKYAYHSIDQDIFLAVIEGKADFNIKLDSHDNTPLHFAIKQSMPKACLKLIEAGADVNTQNKEGKTPLHLAIEKSILEDIYLALIAKGANVNLRDSNGKTPLDCIIGWNFINPKVFLALIEGGADINIKSPRGTLLDIAISEHMPAVCLALIERGANIDTPNSSGKTPLDLAREEAVPNFRKEDMLEVYLALAKKKGEDPSMIDKTCSPLLHSNIEGLEEKNCLMLIENIKNIDILNHNKETPLHLAVKERMLGVCRALIAKEADVNAQNKNGDTPLHLAICDNSSLETARGFLNGTFLRRFIDDRTFDLFQKRELNLNETSLAIISALIEKNANVNIPNKDGKTPLHLAIENNAPEICKLLIQHGATADDKIVNLAKEKGIELTLPKERGAALVFERPKPFEKENKENKADEKQKKPSI